MGEQLTEQTKGNIEFDMVVLSKDAEALVTGTHRPGQKIA
jgi:hypothetical protein